MKGTLLMFTVLGMIAATVQAETCPTVAELKTHALAKGWKIYDTEDGKPLSKPREVKYLKAIDQFALAEWVDKPNHKINTIHCYYRNASGSDLAAYVSNVNFQPKNSPYWYQVSGYQHCAAGTERCEFGRANLGLQFAEK